MILLLLAPALIGMGDVSQEPRAMNFPAAVDQMEAAFGESDRGDQAVIRAWQSLLDPSVPRPASWEELKVLVDLVLDQDFGPGWLAARGTEPPEALPELVDHPISFAWQALAHQRQQADGVEAEASGVSTPVRVWEQAALLVRAVDSQDHGVFEEGRRLASLVAGSGSPDPALLDLANRILQACGPVDGAGPTSRLADPGRFSVVLFRTNHPSSDHLAYHARGLVDLLPFTELAVIEVLLDPEPRGAVQPPFRSGGKRLKGTPALRREAQEWGVHLLPQMVLFNSRGQPVERWRCRKDCMAYVPSRRDPWPELVRSGLGYKLATTLSKIKEDTGWAGFRRTWRSQRASLPFTFSPELFRDQIRFLNLPILGFLLLAAECDRPPKVVFPREPDTPHSLLAVSWFRACSGNPEPWAEILRVLRKPPKGDQAMELILAMADLGMTSPDLPEVLADLARSSSDWRLRAAALRALAFQYIGDSPEPLDRFRKDRRWQVRLAYAEALRGFRHPDSVHALIQLLGDDRMRIRGGAAASMRSLTGAHLGSSSQAFWREWWEQRRDGFRFPRFQAEQVPESRVGEDPETYSASIFGIQIGSDHIIFLLDQSESMLWYRKWEGTIQQLVAFFQAAPATTRFNLIGFSDETDQWRRKLQALNERNTARAIRFVQASPPYGPTNLWSAFELGLKDKDVDCIVLLSDGEPNRGEFQKPAEFLAAVREANRHLRIRIHTVFIYPGLTLPFEDHHCDGTCPPLADPPGEDWMETRRNSILAANRHARFLKDLAALSGGEVTVGFAPPHRLRPP